MAVDTRVATAAPPEHLLQLALSRPRDAYAEATRLLDERPDPLAASVAHQVRGIVLRDNGDQAGGLAELREALRLARRSAVPDRVAEVEASLGLTLAQAGRTRAGLAALDRALRDSRGVLAGRVLMRRSSVLRMMGRYDEALADLRRGIRQLRRGGDAVWEARSRTNRFLVYSALGQAARADRDLLIAERLFAAAGQELESAMAVHNRADVAYQAGDLPAALGLLDEAESRYIALGADRPSVALDRCAVLLASGLAIEAVTATEEALRRYVRRGGEATRTAEMMFASATAAQAAQRPDLAAGRAAAARALFRRQGRRAWQARAAFVELQARYDAGRPGGRPLDRAGRLADELEALRAPEAPAAHLLAGRLAAARGLDTEADRHYSCAARFRRTGPSFGHAAGWLAQALRADARGATGPALAACRRGLRAAADHQRSLAAPELRAHAAAYGADLGALAQRHAVRRGDARMLLSWSERWRASALAVPAVRPPEDRTLAADLAALRRIVRGLESARRDGGATDRLEHERRRLESAIRARTRSLRLADPAGAGEADVDPGDLASLLDGLGRQTLIEIASVDGTLYAIVVSGRRVRAHEVGPLAAAIQEVTHARFLLRRLAYGRASPGASAGLAETGARLQRALLGAAATEVDHAEVVIVPPARLHAVPWSLLPALHTTPFTVAPSAATWLRAGRARTPRDRRVTLVVGPGLSGTAEEVALIALQYPDATVLRDGAASVETALAALDGAWTAHIAAHGVFRADNPLFSALSMDDGPLTVYDLGRMRRSPRRLVLSSCESAVAAQVGPDELLGTVTALIPLGTASILASVVPVNDVATAPLMVRFHERLRAGDSFGTAACAVRAHADAVADPIAAATAASYVSLGR
jgi:tetratricopeptide (TPR) repeat protein